METKEEIRDRKGQTGHEHEHELTELESHGNNIGLTRFTRWVYIFITAMLFL